MKLRQWSRAETPSVVESRFNSPTLTVQDNDVDLNQPEAADDGIRALVDSVNPSSSIPVTALATVGCTSSDFNTSNAGSIHLPDLFNDEYVNEYIPEHVVEPTAVVIESKYCPNEILTVVAPPTSPTFNGSLDITNTPTTPQPISSYKLSVAHLQIETPFEKFKKIIGLAQVRKYEDPQFESLLKGTQAVVPPDVYCLLQNEYKTFKMLKEYDSNLRTLPELPKPKPKLRAGKRKNTKLVPEKRYFVVTSDESIEAKKKKIAEKKQQEEEKQLRKEEREKKKTLKAEIKNEKIANKKQKKSIKK